MSAAYESSDSATTNGSTLTSLTLTGVTLTGSNRNLAVCSGSRRSNEITITSIVRTGESDTFESKAGVFEPNSQTRVWNSTNEPDLGPANLVVSFTSDAQTSVGYIAATGVDQTTRYEATQVSNGFTTVAGADVTVTSAVGDLICTALCVSNVTSLAATGTNHTKRIDEPMTTQGEFAMGSAPGAATLQVGYSWTSANVAWVLYGWNHPAAIVGSPPVLTVPASGSSAFGSPTISGFSFTDADDDVVAIEASCEATMTITFDLSGTSVSDGSTNGTNAVVLSGTNADLVTVIGQDIVLTRAELWPTYQATNTVTLTVIDDEGNEDEETYAHTWTATGAVFITSDFDATLQALEWTPPTDGTGNFNIRIVATSSEPLSDTADFQFVVLGVGPEVTAPGSVAAQYGFSEAISGVSVSHADTLTTSLHFQCSIAMTMTFTAGSTGATITGNGTNDVLIEDTQGDLNTVAATLVVYRDDAAAPVPSNLDPFSANTYTVASNLQLSDVVYTDRTATFVSIPSSYLGSTWISTPNDDKVQSDAATLEFDLNVPAWIYLTRDNRSIETTSIPAWLSSWEPVADEIQTLASGDNVFYSLYRKSFAAGTDAVTLGGYDFGVLYSHYTVLVLPIHPTAPITVTATDSNGLTDVAVFNVVWSVDGGGAPSGATGAKKDFTKYNSAFRTGRRAR